MRVGISGMGRIGRLAARAAMGAAERPEDDPRRGNRLEVVHLNEIKGGATAIAPVVKVVHEATGTRHGQITTTAGILMILRLPEIGCLPF